MGRLENIQYLRAVAALIVVASHAIADVGRATGQPPTLWWPGPFGVEIFFVISGFIIARTTAALSGAHAAVRFAWIRFWRVAPLYWACTTFYVVLSFTMPHLINRNTPDIWHIASSYLFIPYEGRSPVYGLGWSLNYEMFFYGCFAIAMMFAHARWTVAIGFAAFAAMHPLFAPDSAAGFLSQAYILEFLIGMGLAFAADRVRPFLPAWSFWASVGALLGIAAMAYSVEGHSGVTWWSAMVAGMMVAAAAFTRKGPDFRGSMNAVGDASFSLYLLHMFVIRGMAALEPSLPSPVLWALVTSASVGVAILSYRLFERPLSEAARSLLPGRLQLTTA